MAGVATTVFISTFSANSYLCIRVPITGSLKSYFSVYPRLRGGVS